MPGKIVAVATGKGGAGKTTLCVMLADWNHRLGHKVAVIDGDKNESLTKWAEQQGKDFPIITTVDVAKIYSDALNLAEDHDLVVIDTPGAVVDSSLVAIAAADLALIPAKPSNEDIAQALIMAGKTRELNETNTKETLIRLVLNEVQLGTVVGDHAADQLAASEFEVLKTIVTQLTAFREMTFNGELPKAGSAGLIARNFNEEVLGIFGLSTDYIYGRQKGAA